MAYLDRKSSSERASPSLASSWCTRRRLLGRPGHSTPPLCYEGMKMLRGGDGNEGDGDYSDVVYGSEERDADMGCDEEPMEVVEGATRGDPSASRGPGRPAEEGNSGGVNADTVEHISIEEDWRKREAPSESAPPGSRSQSISA
eukprot:CAMPEP_0170192468 /NCGR_PEP_ID=MMETSP0040_2-20121228/54299_1 /TAXON_ID=641309 /ORGANISM="Lotharella oceanica, Strain CCMP622" /LENGTH=143 /DNA_ID=CAMNT_0010440857 /DNA_START=31 /DNA_END=459 /DNA_ORIENTATION=+